MLRSRRTRRKSRILRPRRPRRKIRNNWSGLGEETPPMYCSEVHGGFLPIIKGDKLDMC